MFCPYHILSHSFCISLINLDIQKYHHLKKSKSTQLLVRKKRGWFSDAIDTVKGWGEKIVGLIDVVKPISKSK